MMMRRRRKKIEEVCAYNSIRAILAYNRGGEICISGGGSYETGTFIGFFVCK
jgi:hypothetical protein